MNSRDSMSVQKAAIADVQASEDLRHLPINKVGIKAIRHPFKVLDKEWRHSPYHRNLQHVCRVAP